MTLMTCTGMWRVRGLRLRRSSTLQPSTTGSWMSNVIACGWYSLAMDRPVSPRVATSALKPFSRAICTMIRANFTSSSMTSRTRSPSRMCSRSSSTETGVSDVSTGGGSAASSTWLLSATAGGVCCSGAGIATCMSGVGGRRGGDESPGPPDSGGRPSSSGPTYSGGR